MIKPEWGTKRQCPKCNTRFYDLGADEPVHCINCGNEWTPEPILKSKQPLPFEAAPKAEKDEADPAAAELGEDIDLDEDAAAPDDDADEIGGDDDLAEVAEPTEDDEG